MQANIINLGTIPSTDSSAKKILLAEDIISQLLPLFHEEIEEKKSQLERNRSDYLTLKDKIDRNRILLRRVSVDTKRQILIKQILNQINTLVEFEVIFGGNRNSIIQILQDLDSMSIKQLSSSIKTLQKIKKRSIQKVLK
jgi:hypothetical protein